MHYYRTTIQYDGSGYAGFQWQANAHTIQEEINQALKKILEGKVTTTAASRTDTGVHAWDQCVKITSEQPIDDESFLNKFNQALPAQVRCLDVKVCEGTFHPSKDAISKEYRYYFTNSTQFSMEDRRFVSNIANKLDLNAMLACIDYIKGTHDFCNFCSVGSNVRTTIRNVIACELKSTIFTGSDFFKTSPIECFELRIEANGFIKQMIRHLVRALWMVGSGKMTVEQFAALIDGPKSAKQLWKVASPNGLHLYRITYELSDDSKSSLAVKVSDSAGCAKLRGVRADSFDESVSLGNA